MRHRLVLLPVLLATLVCAPPALAWTWPQDGPVLQPFVLGGDPYAAGQHRGIDVAGPPGAVVRAPTSGTVSFAGFVPSGGRTVTIQTADGLAVTLLHLGSLGVARGVFVDEGASVGTLALEGDADHPVPYVQMGVRVAADPQGYLDPLAFLPLRGPAEAPTAPVEEPAADPVTELPADPETSPGAVVAPADPPVEAGEPVVPDAPGGASVPVHAGSAVVEAPATAFEPATESESTPSIDRSVPLEHVSTESTVPARVVETSSPTSRRPADADSAPVEVEPIAAQVGPRTHPRFPVPLAAALTGLLLAAVATGFGWVRRRTAPVPTRIPPRRTPRLTTAIEEPREHLLGPGAPDRRHARSGPHADSAVVALLRRARRARREAIRRA